MCATRRILFRNLDNPQKLTIGPWTHTGDTTLDSAAEHLRWWDRWLKGIDNGIDGRRTRPLLRDRRTRSDGLAVRQGVPVKQSPRGVLDCRS